MNYKQAKIADSAKVAKETVLVGDITIGEESTVLFFTAMRCEGEESIVIGNQSNIQENCTIHVDEGNSVKIGDGVTVGHNSVIHGCQIGDNFMIGMGSLYFVLQDFLPRSSREEYEEVGKLLREDGIL